MRTSPAQSSTCLTPDNNIKVARRVTAAARANKQYKDQDMFSSMTAGAIKVSPESLEHAITLARAAGFGGVDPNPFEVADLIDANGVDAVKDMFGEMQVGASGLPMNWRAEQAEFDKQLDGLPRAAKALSDIGGTRMATFILSFSDDMNWDENYDFHVARFKPIAKILGDHGISIGLEFLGPKTLRDGHAFPFVHTIRAMLQMGRDIGPNVGLLLDCWHWYTSHATVKDLEALTPEQVVHVHVNDAPAGLEINEQIDNVRNLPGATGVIDITAFLQSLKKIGYTGPITPEPFLDSLAQLPDDAARCKAAAAATNGVMAAAGV